MRVRGVAALAGLALALAIPASTSARCAPIDVAQEVAEADFVVEAVVERAGDSATLRTTVVWKGGAQAPAQVALDAHRGRARWEWGEPSSVGHTYVLFLRRSGTGFTVARCGESAEATDGLRAQLRARGLTPQRR
ncbi:MAG: hypothetical protein R3B82_26085 [Sandaracinaceae bacterium]